MTYDGENRPLSVTHNGLTTSYVYAADGTRLKRTEKTGEGTQTTTLYVGPLEIRKPGTAEAQLLAYPHPAIRLTDGVPATLHKDQLNSVRVITNAAGEKAKESIYKPFGEIGWEHVTDLTAPAETKGFIGERFDADSGLQYLNARYYDPELAMFIQPDWFEVTQQGVGTNRYSYSFNDPINRHDPGGNVAPLVAAAAAACSGGGCQAAIAAAAVALGIASLDVTYDGKLDGVLGVKGVAEVNLPSAVASVYGHDEYEDTPLGVDVTGSGKISKDLPSYEDIAGASTEELEDYVGVAEGSLEQRDRELKEDRHGLTSRGNKGKRSRILKEQKVLDKVKQELGLREKLESNNQADKESDDSDDSESNDDEQ